MTPTAHWSEGYATGSGYTFGHFPDLSPRRAAFVMLLAGLDGPPPGPCCELGFGQGVSLVMNAAGDPARRWWGTDFMPQHAAHAQRLVDAAGVDAVIADQSFEHFFARGDLPRFAFIGLHGVWNWVSAANRARIVAFLDRHLLPGGVVYLGHNVLPGWAPMLPLRDLMRQHLQRASPPGRAAAARAAEALAFVQRLLAQPTALGAGSPMLRELLADAAKEPPEYLLHELLNEDWHLASFAQTAAELQGARLDHVGSTELVSRFPAVHHNPAQLAELAAIDDAALRESTRDAMLGRRFRRDLFVRGRRPLSRAEARRRLEDLPLVLAAAPHEVLPRVKGPLGEASLSPEPLAAALRVAADASGSLPAGAVMQAAVGRGLDEPAAVDLLAALVDQRALQPAGTAAEIDAARAPTLRLNRHLSSPHAHSLQLQTLASPVLGCGHPVSAPMQLMMAAERRAPDRPDTWAALAWQAMQADGRQIKREQQRVTDRAAAEAALQPVVQQWQQTIRPLLARLGIEP